MSDWNAVLVRIWVRPGRTKEEEGDGVSLGEFDSKRASGRRQEMIFSPASLFERKKEGGILEPTVSKKPCWWVGERGSVSSEEEREEGEGEGERGSGEAFVLIWSESSSRKHAGSRERVIVGV